MGWCESYIGPKTIAPNYRSGSGQLSTARNPDRECHHKSKVRMHISPQNGGIRFFSLSTAFSAITRGPRLISACVAY